MEQTKTKKKRKAKGLGDTLHNIFEATGIKKVVETVTEALGEEDCGCGKRQERLNNLFPYKSDEPDAKYVEHSGMRLRVYD